MTKHMRTMVQIFHLFRRPLLLLMLQCNGVSRAYPAAIHRCHDVRRRANRGPFRNGREFRQVRPWYVTELHEKPGWLCGKHYKGVDRRLYKTTGRSEGCWYALHATPHRLLTLTSYYQGVQGHQNRGWDNKESMLWQCKSREFVTWTQVCLAAAL